MPKRVFWPATLVAMGLIFLASNLGYLPTQFWNFWPVLLIIVGLGGLLTSDREDWMAWPGKRNASSVSASRVSAKSTARRSKAKGRARR